MDKDADRETDDDRKPDWDMTEGTVDRQDKIRVPLSVYIVSVVLVALVVFILMLVQYLPGYRNNARLSSVIDKAQSVDLTTEIQHKYLTDRDLSYDIESEIEEALLDMGAKKATVRVIDIDRTKNDDTKDKTKSTTPRPKDSPD